MKKLKFLLLPIFLLLIMGCDRDNITHELPEDYAPGEVLVKFDESITKDEAEGFIKSLSLEPLNLSVLETDEYLWSLVGVPEGREKDWLKKFLRYSFVEDAELNGIVHAD